MNKARRIVNGTPQKLNEPWYPYTQEELEGANKQWGCNCGPGALATMTGLKPENVLPHIPRFQERRYTNPTMMAHAIRSLGLRIKFARMQTHLTEYGLCRIQWHGPWTRPGVPAAAAYRKTHWIGAMIIEDIQWVFDINCGWVEALEWEQETVPGLVKMHPGADGKWSATHRWELVFPEGGK